MNIAFYMIDIILIYHNLRITTLHEFLTQVLKRCIQSNRLNFSTRNHTIPYSGIREIQSVLEYLDLIVNIRILLCIIYTGLDKIIQIHFRESFIPSLIIHFNTKNLQQYLTQKSTELTDRPKDDIT